MATYSENISHFFCYEMLLKPTTLNRSADIPLYVLIETALYEIVHRQHIPEIRNRSNLRRDAGCRKNGQTLQ